MAVDVSGGHRSSMWLIALLLCAGGTSCVARSNSAAAAAAASSPSRHDIRRGGYLTQDGVTRLASGYAFTSGRGQLARPKAFLTKLILTVRGGDSEDGDHDNNSSDGPKRRRRRRKRTTPAPTTGTPEQQHVEASEGTQESAMEGATKSDEGVQEEEGSTGESKSWLESYLSGSNSRSASAEQVVSTQGSQGHTDDDDAAAAAAAAIGAAQSDDGIAAVPNTEEAAVLADEGTNSDVEDGAKLDGGKRRKRRRRRIPSSSVTQVTADVGDMFEKPREDSTAASAKTAAGNVIAEQSDGMIRQGIAEIVEPGTIDIESVEDNDREQDIKESLSTAEPNGDVRMAGRTKIRKRRRRRKIASSLGDEISSIPAVGEVGSDETILDIKDEFKVAPASVDDDVSGDESGSLITIESDENAPVSVQTDTQEAEEGNEDVSGEILPTGITETESNAPEEDAMLTESDQNEDKSVQEAESSSIEDESGEKEEVKIQAKSDNEESAAEVPVEDDIIMGESLPVEANESNAEMVVEIESNVSVDKSKESEEESATDTTDSSDEDEGVSESDGDGDGGEEQLPTVESESVSEHQDSEEVAEVSDKVDDSGDSDDSSIEETSESEEEVECSDAEVDEEEEEEEGKEEDEKSVEDIEGSKENLSPLEEAQNGQGDLRDIPTGAASVTSTEGKVVDEGEAEAEKRTSIGENDDEGPDDSHQEPEVTLAEATSDVSALNQEDASVASLDTCELNQQARIAPEIIDEENEDDESTKITVSVVTWNLAEASPSEDEARFIRRFRKAHPSLSKHNERGGSDIVLIGGQETENTKPRRAEGSRSRELRRLMIKMLGKEYVPIALHSLGGVQFGLFVQRDILDQIELCRVADVACGVGNVFHNKGAICAYVQMKARTKEDGKGSKNLQKSVKMLFVSAHMAAHVKNVDARNQDFWRIASELEAQAPPRFLRPKSPREHEASNAAGEGRSYLMDAMDHVFFCGDLNYRVDLPREVTEYTVMKISELLAKDDLRRAGELRLSLLRYDQLTRVMSEGAAFPGFAEGKITFAPTFKFDKGSKSYDTSHKQRIPAWTDRILFKPFGVKVLEYRSEVDATHSDHRPVSGTFLVDIGAKELPQSKQKSKRNRRRRKPNNHDF